MKTSVMTVALTALLSMSLTAPAAAQTTSGQIGLRGFVASRCGTTSGSAGAEAFAGTISLGELGNTEARMRASLINSTAGSPAGLIAYQVGCTGTTATITLSATRLSTTNPVTGGDGAYVLSNDIDYTAQVAMALTGGGITTLNYTTAATLPTPSRITVSEGFAYIPDNFEIRVFGLMPEGGDQSVLVAGNYDATITVTVSPS